ncbi:MAG: twin-arginine translocation signal domain-containing protein [Acidobacteria bacterium]|nr:twin-arginine translocation signal domain-containing protein [Acidobacteriota bacterium]
MKTDYEQHQTLSRRGFIRHSATAVGAIGIAGLNPELTGATPTAPRAATDWVQLGRINKGQLMITRLGIGTGSLNGRVQMELGQPTH